jgi:hypothetical protein
VIGGNRFGGNRVDGNRAVDDRVGANRFGGNKVGAVSFDGSRFCGHGFGKVVSGVGAGRTRVGWLGTCCGCSGLTCLGMCWMRLGCRRFGTGEAEAGSQRGDVGGLLGGGRLRRNHGWRLQGGCRPAESAGQQHGVCGRQQRAVSLAEGADPNQAGLFDNPLGPGDHASSGHGGGLGGVHVDGEVPAH